ncbi:hypothetical protein ACIBG0_38290 [Nocardia sp. NPDC050630]|uniref:hypothetical protein n=1 Tax=Nocardia sp. NPDC050630 TaxID=3364321 RepID=UPI0037A51033
MTGQIMKKTVVGCAAVVAFALGGGTAMGSAAASPGIALEPAPANTSEIAVATAAGTGSVNAAVQVLKLLGITSMCTFSANYQGCNGQMW